MAPRTVPLSRRLWPAGVYGFPYAVCVLPMASAPSILSGQHASAASLRRRASEVTRWSGWCPRWPAPLTVRCAPPRMPAVHPDPGRHPSVPGERSHRQSGRAVRPGPRRCWCVERVDVLDCVVESALLPARRAALSEDPWPVTRAEHLLGGRAGPFPAVRARLQARVLMVAAKACVGWRPREGARPREPVRKLPVVVEVQLLIELNEEPRLRWRCPTSRR